VEIPPSSSGTLSISGAGLFGSITHCRFLDQGHLEITLCPVSLTLMET
jgi:hypothetical protein